MTADVIIGKPSRKDAKGLSTQPNQITDLRMTPTLYSERAMDELVWTLQPFYTAAKRRENRGKEATQLLFDFNNPDAYLVTPDKATSIEHEGDFVATIRFRDLPGITPKHYAEVRQVIKDLVKTVAEVHTDDGVLTTNLIDVVEEFEKREITDPKTGEKKMTKGNKLKRNEIKIRIRNEILRHNFFLTDSGYTQFYFPATRHTKTATANRIYKWLSKWRGIRREQMEMVEQELPNGTTREVGQIVFAADYIEVRSVCGLYTSEDGKVINGEHIEPAASSLAEKDGHVWASLKPSEKEKYLSAARTKAEEKYAYYSEFAKRYLAQAKKELDDLSERGIADFTFDYKAIFADGRAKGKVPVQVEFTLYILDLGRELYEDKEAANKEIEARKLMKEELSLTAEQINEFIRRLQKGDHDHLLVKLQFLIAENAKRPRNDVQHWACKSLNTFFSTELPKQRGFTPAVEVTMSPSSSSEPEKDGAWRINGGITPKERQAFQELKADLRKAWSRNTEDEKGFASLLDPLRLDGVNDMAGALRLRNDKHSFNREFAVPYYWNPADFDQAVARHFKGYRWVS